MSQFKIEEMFGANVFGDKQQRERLPAQVYKTLKRCIEKGETIPLEVVDCFALAVKDWALSKGATHFSHWFQPLNGKPCGKSDSFLAYSENGVLSEFSGKTLLRGETDGSSFPSGGSRVTHEARGYTGWDPSSSPFILDVGNAPTLYIPSYFVSWKGHALDHRLPLLRSHQALEKETLKLLSAAGFEGHSCVYTNSGIEQEFFLIDRDYYLKRPDLVATGRTLLGAAPPKGQELEDQYFGTLSERMLRCIREIEDMMWRLGLPVTTRHREVAPNQYEISPIYEKSSVASEHNMLMMEVMKMVSRRHNLVCLLHEKPFAGVNGSGKHNNWSVGTDLIPTLYTPGPNPGENQIFMLMLAGTIRAVDLHGDLIRWAISGASNDHRLGANEAPPAIISVYLGDDLEALVESTISGKPMEQVCTDLPLGVAHLPKFATTRQPTDRNRTSPFAFTGNKFEVRAVGSSQNPSISNTILNGLIADSAKYLSNEIENRMKSPNAVRKDVVNQLVKETLAKHKRIIFGGNGYGADWPIEAEKRGLPNLRTTPQVLEYVHRKENIRLFSEHGILSPEEFSARVEVDLENYVKTIRIEARALSNMIFTKVLPAAQQYQTVTGSAIQTATSHGLEADGQEDLLKKLTANINQALKHVAIVDNGVDHLKSLADSHDQAKYCVELLEKMYAARTSCDAIENIIDRALWPMPSYHDILFYQD